MLVSSVIALTGIGLAWFFFLKNPSTSDAIAQSAAPVHRLLLNKYYVDELYDSAVVHPIQSVIGTRALEGRGCRHHRRRRERRRRPS